ncbi:amidase signature domain-containing protein [Xylariales sp. PMI_506]|nr:amidase signature domain-containing protein [Xylariales sp. PMI_506]
MALKGRDANLVECSIAELRRMLQLRATNAVDLVSRYLARIAAYDARGPMLNSVCVLNPNVFLEAQASDDWRASGRPPRPLEGIPYTVKDSYKVKGMPAAAGSPAFADLMATEDCFVVERLRSAGAVLIGRTNMPPMADGGCQRGVYGRGESPYNLEYLTAAFASGSSNGSGTSTAASFAAFGMGGETVSSGRSPASNNALVGYSPSRGVISCRGAWPLYPTCDVLVPHTRCVQDMLEVLDLLVADDVRTRGDFWREQPHVQIPAVSDIRPESYRDLAVGSQNFLRGKRVAVPRCYIGIDDANMKAVHISDSVLSLWRRARDDLEALGATVVDTTFPLVANYERNSAEGKSCHVDGLPETWNEIERSTMIALCWDDFLRDNSDPSIPTLAATDPKRIHTRVAPMDDPNAYTEAQNIVRYEDMLEKARNRTGALWQISGCDTALHALEAARKRDLEEWMDQNGFDLVAFPTAGDVARADSELLHASMRDALRDGVKYANGGRALKHLGVPAVTVPMGEITEIGMPVGLTFLTKAYKDSEILSAAFAFEQATHRRRAPPLTPALPTDIIKMRPAKCCAKSFTETPSLIITTQKLLKPLHKDNTLSQSWELEMEGSVAYGEDGVHDVPEVDIMVNGEIVGQPNSSKGSWSWKGSVQSPQTVKDFRTERTVPGNHVMITVVSRASNGRSTGQLLLLK